jgi:hypothetical protein
MSDELKVDPVTEREGGRKERRHQKAGHFFMRGFRARGVPALR